MVPMQQQMISRQDHWERAISTFMVACVGVIALFWQTAHTMVDVWAHSRTYAHGMLVLPATIYLVWCHRDGLLGLVPQSNRAGFALCAVLAGGWYLGRMTQMPVIQESAVLAMLPALVLTIFGKTVFHLLRFPLGFLVFALPVGTAIEPWLQDVTTGFIVVGLELAGIPLQRDGYVITIASGSWEVARECAGLRYLLPGLALGYVYTAVVHRTLMQRLTFLMVCSGALIVANGMRAYGIILGDHFGIAEGTDHRVFSYTIYAITMTYLGWLGLKWCDGSEKTPTATASPVSAARYFHSSR
jgi:exosortase A